MHVELVIDPALAELDVRVAQVELEALAGLEDQVVPAVRAALVVPENPVAPVGLAVRVAPVALANRVVLEVVPVVAVPVLDQVEAQRRTRSATAAHPHDLVPAPRVEDSAAVVETTRAPAATEAGVAWAAAVTAAAVVAEDAAAAG